MPWGRIQRTTYNEEEAPGTVLSVARGITEATPQGEVIYRFTYNKHGLRTAAIDPRAEAGQEAEYATQYTYDHRGWLVKLTDPLKSETLLKYDSIGNLTEQTDPLGRITRYGYDAVGRRTSVMYPDGAVVAMHYDLAGYLQRERDPLGSETRYEYDGGCQVQPVASPV